LGELFLQSWIDFYKNRFTEYLAKVHIDLGGGFLLKDKDKDKDIKLKRQKDESHFYIRRPFKTSQ
jgi:hypothetical protein